MKATEFDNKFDSGEDITGLLDLSKAKRINLTPKRINLNMPQWMIDELNKEALKLGVSRQSVINIWLAERLQATA
ncbi:MAG: CopG family antitoxin [Candidatus Kapabacteria bacterium]|nr:CopG family antitoxin [Candidatus Kapabacteria bacterium]